MKTDKLFVSEREKAFVSMMKFFRARARQQKEYKGVSLMPGVIGCHLGEIVLSSDCSVRNIEWAFKHAIDNNLIEVETKDHIDFLITLDR